MATAAVTNQFTASTTIVSDDVDTNFSDLVTFLNGSVLHLDGAKTMTGDLNMGEQDINNVPWKTWAPTYANLTVASGSVTARYIAVGDLIACHYTLTLGSDTVIGTSPTITTPVTANAAHTVVKNAVGQAMFDDVGTETLKGAVRLQSTTTFAPVIFIVSGTHMRESDLSATVPLTWTNGDAFSFSAVYQGA